MSELYWKGKNHCIKSLKKLPNSTMTMLSDNDSKNMIIVGDNEQTLKILQKKHKNKFKVIHLDMSTTAIEYYMFHHYNDETYTEKDKEEDNNDIFHEISNSLPKIDANVIPIEDILSAFFIRLKLANELLLSDGVILLETDFINYLLESMLSEIFGEEVKMGLCICQDSGKKMFLIYKTKEMYLKIQEQRNNGNLDHFNSINKLKKYLEILTDEEDTILSVSFSSILPIYSCIQLNTDNMNKRNWIIAQTKLPVKFFREEEEIEEVKDMEEGMEEKEEINEEIEEADIKEEIKDIEEEVSHEMLLVIKNIYDYETLLGLDNHEPQLFMVIKNGHQIY